MAPRRHTGWPTPRARGGGPFAPGRQSCRPATRRPGARAAAARAARRGATTPPGPARPPARTRPPSAPRPTAPAGAGPAPRPGPPGPPCRPPPAAPPRLRAARAGAVPGSGGEGCREMQGVCEGVGIRWGEVGGGQVPRKHPRHLRAAGAHHKPVSDGAPRVLLHE